ncbi:hypothetical protein LJC63_07775, partial [Ruminococcaceae bacterium OttesenSCG-928-L11]|nr:hypothetical protein [Ruminococcaceae bacterium OttesenSCG-928-L11]
KQKHDEILALSDGEIDSKITRIVKNLEALDAENSTWREADAALGDFEMLLAYRDINTAAIAEAAFPKVVYTPAAIYRDAEPEVRDALIRELKKPDCEEAGNIQSALALIGDDVVQRAFMKLEGNPLPCREKLYVNPSVYAEAGGWSFDESGQRQTLVHDTCYAMHSDAASPDSAVRIGKKRDDRCAVCGCQMIDALVLDSRDPRLAFLGIEGILRVPICPWCACFTEDNIIRYQLDGASSYEVKIDPYFSENKLDAKYIDEMDTNTWVLDEGPSPVYRSYGGDEAPTIGGMAQWIQDWTYMTCPDCGKKMTYLASIPWSCISDGFEGTLYIEICTDCRVVKVLHQQT